MSQEPEGQPDIRVRRTRGHLRSALLGLAGEQGYQKVTVGDIADRAMINRATFYRYYEDKDDLAADILVHAARSTGDLSPITDGTLDMDARIASGALLFDHIAQHDRLYRPLLAYPRSRRFLIRARSLLGGLVQERIDAVPRPDGRRMPEEMVVTFAAELFLGMAAWWLENGTTHSSRQMSTWFTQFLFFGYFNALGIEDLLPRLPPRAEQ
ncbi:TetR/AcrR family transcriptional regulator [Nocardia sp. NPDC019395]|uniref:TetR/AcrR family transcriptional regulator n=1 Tax=Nocardia sp. NPDC019395 TaxID=3154686 RepID=UPI003409CA44